MEIRLLFVRLVDSEPVSVLELVDGVWVETEPNEYYSNSDDLYFTALEDENVWTDDDGFVAAAVGEVGEPPAPDHAQEVSESFAAYIAEMYEDEEDLAPVDCVMFVYDAGAEENES